MSKYIFILLFILSGTLLHSQLIWEKTWGGPFDDGCEVRNTQDGGIIALATYGIDSWLLRLDANGDTIWTRRIGKPLDFCAVTETHNGGFILAGLTRNQHRDIVALKVDARGDSVWMRTYVDSLNSQGLYSILACQDRSFLISGYTSENGYDVLAMRIDTLGNLLWRRNYGGSSFEGGSSASQTSDGGFVLTTTTGNAFTPHIWVLRIDSAGDTLWSRHFVESAPTGGPIPTVLPDGRILIMGWIQPIDYDNYLLCLDATGNRLWNRQYGGIGFESRTARGIIADQLGGLSFVSSVDRSYAPTGSDFDIALYRLDSLGLVQHIYRLGYAGDDMPRYFDQASNGDYLILGFSNSFSINSQQTYLGRLRTTGCVAQFYDLNGPLRDTLCPGDSLRLDAGPGFAHYSWSDGDTQQVRFVAQSDTFYVEATDSTGCLHYSSGIAVAALQGPNFVWSPVSGLSLQFDGTSGDASQLSWDFGDGTFSMIADPAHTFPAPGSYFVCLSGLIGPCGWVQICDSIEVLNPLHTAEEAKILPKVFPNPATTQLVVQNPLQDTLSCRMFSSDGRLLQSWTCPATGQYTLYLERFPPGIYLIDFHSSSQRFAAQKVLVR